MSDRVVTGRTEQRRRKGLEEEKGKKRTNLIRLKSPNSTNPNPNPMEKRKDKGGSTLTHSPLSPPPAHWKKLPPPRVREEAEPWARDQKTDTEPRTPATGHHCGAIRRHHARLWLHASAGEGCRSGAVTGSPP
jgi:hypothetical protein